MYETTALVKLLKKVPLPQLINGQGVQETRNCDLLDRSVWTWVGMISTTATSLCPSEYAQGPAGPDCWAN